MKITPAVALGLAEVELFGAARNYAAPAFAGVSEAQAAYQLRIAAIGYALCVKNPEKRARELERQLREGQP